MEFIRMQKGMRQLPSAFTNISVGRCQVRIDTRTERFDDFIKRPKISNKDEKQYPFRRKRIIRSTRNAGFVLINPAFLI